MVGASTAASGEELDVVVIPGDGIGVEVTEAAMEVLGAVVARHRIPLRTTTVDWGCDHHVRSGAMAPDGWLDRLWACDAVLLGAVGRPDVPDDVSLWGLLIPIRREFDQYVNLRPLRTIPGFPGALRDQPDIDVVIVRENSEGEYSRVGGRVFADTPREIALQESVFSRYGVERVVRYACEVASGRRGHLVAATKSNGIIHTMPFWDETVRRIAAEHDVRLEIQHVDALAARMVSDPGGLDTIVASNLFGDILSDLGAAVIGGLGLAASGNLNPERTAPSMFEPVHGSAPDIVGMGVANPLGQFLSVSLMLHHLGHAEAGADVESAVRSAVGERGVRTRDIGGSATTTEMLSAVMAEL